MKNMKTGQPVLGPIEMRFFSWAQSKRRTELKTGDLVQALKLSPKQEADLLYNLSRRGLLLKLWRGFYLVPERLPAGGQWSPSPYLIINSYMTELKATYQISGPVVFNSYGYSTQMASEFAIYNNRVSKKVDIRQYKFAFVKVDEKRLGATKEFQPYGESKNAVAIFSTQPRMLLDAIADYKRFGTLPEAYGWILGAIKDKKVSVKEMADVVCKFANTTSKKRIGWILEKASPKSKEIERIADVIPKTEFLVPLLPENFDGPINQKWGVIENFKVPT
jgi:predicted transcriptional regulator of viral defense system